MSGYISPQQPIQPQPPLQPVYQEEKGLTVCGIVGVVFGALGFVLSFIPIINNIAAIHWRDSCDCGIGRHVPR
jgi:hypothetical protein